MCKTVEKPLTFGFALSVHLCTSCRALNLCSAEANLTHSSVSPQTHHTSLHQPERDSQPFTVSLAPHPTPNPPFASLSPPTSPVVSSCLHCDESVSAHESEERYSRAELWLVDLYGIPDENPWEGDPIMPHSKPHRNTLINAKRVCTLSFLHKWN